jgi:hypothetical protein
LKRTLTLTIALVALAASAMSSMANGDEYQYPVTLAQDAIDADFRSINDASDGSLEQNQALRKLRADTERFIEAVQRRAKAEKDGSYWGHPGHDTHTH